MCLFLPGWAVCVCVCLCLDVSMYYSVKGLRIHSAVLRSRLAFTPSAVNFLPSLSLLWSAPFLFPFGPLPYFPQNIYISTGKPALPYLNTSWVVYNSIFTLRYSFQKNNSAFTVLLLIEKTNELSVSYSNLKIVTVCLSSAFLSKLSQVEGSVAWNIMADI